MENLRHVLVWGRKRFSLYLGINLFIVKCPYHIAHDIYYCLEKSALFEMKNESEQRVFNKMADQLPASCDFS